MSQSSRPDHDALYHRLFGYPGVVGQFLRGFVDGPEIDLSDLDLDGMERLNAKFHADTGQRREGDMIWRIPRRDGADVFLVLLLEFQSTSDQYMAVRVLTYVGLVWQQLIREGRLLPGGRLPPVLPVVLYNGDPRWRAPVAARELVGLPEGAPLWRWQPDSRYYLVDAGAFSEADLAARDGLPALWFRLEGASDPGQAAVVVEAVLAWLGRHPGFSEARALFAELLGAMMAPLGAGPGVMEDLLDMQSRLVTRAEQWKRDWRQDGIQEGRREGFQAGLHKGEAALLLRLLERRFGALPDAVKDRVGAADISMLEDWGMRILDAATLDDVIGPRPTT